MTGADGGGEARAASYREVFGVPEFRALFAAQLASVVGDQFARVALTVMVYASTGSAALTALTYALTFLPQLVAGPLLGGLADRYPRRGVMVAADLARAVLVAAMAVPGLPLAGVCALLVAVQLLAAPFNAARAATLPLILAGDRYVVAGAVSNLTHQLAQLLGFAAGGVLVAGVEPTGALLVDAATFAVSAAVIGRGVRRRPAPAPVTGGPATVPGEGWAARLVAGARLVGGDRRQRALLWLLCVCAVPVVAEALAVPYADDLGAGPAAVGLLLAAGPAGAVVGMLLIRRLAPATRLRLVRPLATASCAVLVGCAARPPLAPTIALWLLSGAAMGYFVVANAELVLAVPDGRRGQVVGLVSAAVRAAQGVAVLVAGAAAELLAPAMVVAAAGGLGAVAAAAAATGWLRAGAAAGAGAPAGGAA